MAKLSSAFGHAVRAIRPPSFGIRSLSVNCVQRLWPSVLASPPACLHLTQGERPAFGRCFASQTPSAEAAAGEATPVGELISFLQELRRTPLSEDEKDPEGPLARYDAAGTSLQRRLIAGEISDRISVLKALAELGTVPGRPYPIAVHFLFFLEEYVEILESLRDGETIADRATELREVLLCFHRAGLSPDRLKQIYAHIQREFPQFEAAGALLPMPAAVQLCHTMLSTGLSSPAAVLVLLRSALREPLLHVADDSKELRLLKTIEILIRLDFLHTQEQMTPDVLEYLSVIRDLRFYDRELRRETALSYQMAYFLRKHGFPAKRKMLGPYVLKVCDPDERINFEPVEERNWRFGLVEEPPARKKRHLESMGWRCIEVQSATWRNLSTYDAKAGYIRQLLKDNELLTL